VTALPEGSYVSEEVTCVTAEEMAAYRAQMEARVEGGCPQPMPVEEACTSRQMRYLGNAGLIATGSCRLPYGTLAQIQSNLAAGDILYVQPGTYPTSGVVLSTPAQILGPGGAVFGGN